MRPPMPQGLPPLVRRLLALAARWGDGAALALPPPRVVQRGVPGGTLAPAPAGCLLDRHGSAAEIGTAGGELLGRSTRWLLQRIRACPPLLTAGRRTRAPLAAMPSAQVEEGVAWARAAGCAPEVLLAATAVADCACTLVVRPAGDGRPLRVARNLDFFPAGALGRTTVVSCTHRTGCLPVVAVGWPGFVGVLSGMNGQGVCASVLLNLASPACPPVGEPIACRVRTILEQARSVEEAVGWFAQAAVASSHYLVLADPWSASVVWQQDGRLHRQDAGAGPLICSNGARSPTGEAIDDRGRHLQALLPWAVDDDHLRGLLAGSYIPGTNAQAMVFEPAGLVLEWAVGSARAPAATAAWHRLALGPALDGGSLAATPITACGRTPRPAHFAHAPLPPPARGTPGWTWPRWSANRR